MKNVSSKIIALFTIAVGFILTGTTFCFAQEQTRVAAFRLTRDGRKIAVGGFVVTPQNSVVAPDQPGSHAWFWSVDPNILAGVSLKDESGHITALLNVKDTIECDRGIISSGIGNLVSLTRQDWNGREITETIIDRKQIENGLYITTANDTHFTVTDLAYNFSGKVKPGRIWEQIPLDRSREFFDKSIEASSKIIERDPSDDFAYIWRATAKMGKGELDGAVEDLMKQRFDRDLLGIAKQAKGDWKGAALEFRTYSRLRIINRATNGLMNDMIKEHYDTFKKAWSRDVDGALVDINQIIQAKPDDALAFRLRATLQLQKNNADEAIVDYTKFLEFNPNDGDGYYRRGVARLFKNDFDGAIKDWTKATDLNPKHADAHDALGVENFATGDLDLAIKEFSASISAGNDAFLERGAAMQAKGNKDGAIADYNEIIRRWINYPVPGYIARASAHLAKGDKSAAAEDYIKAIECNREASK